VQELARVLFRSRAGSYLPKVLLVGDDIDPTNLDELVWAFATRNHPEQDQYLFHGESVLPLVAFLRPEERKAARGTKVIYDCLATESGDPSELPRRSSFRFAWPAEIQQKVRDNWHRYGFAEP
jgi:4-hydroxy-3-polyprenylbenzoate decarboxylase